MKDYTLKEARNLAEYYTAATGLPIDISGMVPGTALNDTCAMMVNAIHGEDQDRIIAIHDGEDHEDDFENIEIPIPCKGRDCEHDTNNDPTVSERHDAYGLSTGHYCDHCYDHNYPYRKDSYFDPSFAGERMDDDY